MAQQMVLALACHKTWYCCKDISAYRSREAKYSL